MVEGIWFVDIKRLSDKEVEDSRVVWIHIFGIPVNMWGSEFFVELSNFLSAFICVDEHWFQNSKCYQSGGQWCFVLVE